VKHGNLPDIFRDFSGLINKIPGLSRTFQDSKKKSRTFPGCGNPASNELVGNQPK